MYKSYGELFRVVDPGMTQRRGYTPTYKSCSDSLRVGDL